MKNRDDSKALIGLLLIDEAYWRGKKRGDGKRGRGATGKMPVVTALSLSPEGHPLYLKLSHLSGFTKDEISAWSAKHLRPESHVASDGLNCFPPVTKNQCQHEPIVTSAGGKYDDRKVFQWLNTVCYWQREKRFARYPSCHQRQALASLSCRILLSFQPPVSTRYVYRLL